MPRVTFRNSRGLQLVGDLVPAGASPVPGDPTPAGDRALVVMAHGFASDRHSRGRFPRIAAALAGAGLASLAFDFAGCGESDDDVLTLDHQIDDLHAAIAHARSLGYERLGAPRPQPGRPRVPGGRPAAGAHHRHDRRAHRADALRLARLLHAHPEGRARPRRPRDDAPGRGAHKARRSSRAPGSSRRWSTATRRPCSAACAVRCC